MDGNDNAENRHFLGSEGEGLVAMLATGQSRSCIRACEYMVIHDSGAMWPITLEE